MACQVYIPDQGDDSRLLEGQVKQDNKIPNNAKKLRMRILPFLADLGTFKSIKYNR